MDLHKKVSKLSKEELVELVMDLVEEDEDVQKKLEFKLLTPRDEVKASKQLIRKYINENKRRGFISWRNVHAALQGAEMVLDKGRNKLVNGEEEMAVRLGITVLSTVIDMLQYTDDSGGDIDFVVNKALTLLQDASSMVLLSADHRVQDNMFDLLLKESMHKRYDGWNDTRHELLNVCTIYSAHSSARLKLEEELDKLYTQISTENSLSSDYDQELIKKLQLKILERNGETEKAEQFVKENLQFDEFREMAIAKEMENGNYQSALSLCEAGEKNDSKYPGLMKQWKQYRLQIYEALEDIVKQKEILLEFVYDNEYEAYGKLKDLYPPEQWKMVIEEIFDGLEDKSGYLPHMYEYIAKAENRADKILQYCELYPMTILELYPYLLEEYTGKVDELFKRHIKGEAEHASERKQYRNVCEKLKIYNNACGESKFQDLVHELKQIYHRKPAFVNELEKVEKSAV
ncbi:DUF6880 family protein [Oceanobacillus salinisoli]|uniref:DUF6880 family protein n=1 Tax=Oceanobacillus salinisoli TaxID=2678611 RepID=UPI0012E23754|nr:DUF6880 family protein [Oceanobacillus salinisoli]